jgi:hypothetical protein
VYAGNELWGAVAWSLIVPSENVVAAAVASPCLVDSIGKFCVLVLFCTRFEAQLRTLTAAAVKDNQISNTPCVSQLCAWLSAFTTALAYFHDHKYASHSQPHDLLLLQRGCTHDLPLLQGARTGACCKGGGGAAFWER